MTDHLVECEVFRRKQADAIRTLTAERDRYDEDLRTLALAVHKLRAALTRIKIYTHHANLTMDMQATVHKWATEALKGEATA